MQLTKPRLSQFWGEQSHKYHNILRRHTINKSTRELNLPNRGSTSLAFIHVPAVRVVQSLLFLDRDRNFGDCEGQRRGDKILETSKPRHRLALCLE